LIDFPRPPISSDSRDGPSCRSVGTALFEQRQTAAQAGENKIASQSVDIVRWAAEIARVCGFATGSLREPPVNPRSGLRLAEKGARPAARLGRRDKPAAPVYV
jgi:hypothetical protein